MYKYIEDGISAIWEPLDKNLGIAIVKEVTSKTSTAEKLVEVNAVEREQILKLYAERNNDPVVEVEKVKTPEELVNEIKEMNLVTQEAIATMYEESGMSNEKLYNAIAKIMKDAEERNINIDEVLASIYEEILGGA